MLFTELYVGPLSFFETCALFKFVVNRDVFDDVWHGIGMDTVRDCQAAFPVG